MKQRILALVAAALTLTGSIGANAQSGYPNRPIHLIVPTSTGGGADALARAIAPRISQSLGQPVIVENRAGAAGNIAAEQVSKAPPDGYTILVGAIAPLGINPTLFKLPYDPVRDFAPITMGVAFGNVLVAHPSVPANNVKELLALARAKPGTLNFGSAGPGTIGHLAGELFAIKGDVNIVHVPYKGGGPAMTDLLGGQVQLVFASPPSAMGFIKAGRLKALGVTTRQRMPQLPDVPTIAESGIPGYEAINWYCFVAPANTPKDVIARLNAEIRKAMDNPEVRETLNAQGLDPTPSTPEELGRFIQSEVEKWRKVITERKITPE